jgi:hypothetical protein
VRLDLEGKKLTRDVLLTEGRSVDADRITLMVRLVSVVVNLMAFVVRLINTFLNC